MLQKLRGNTKGFTLIELMIVIAIIGILAAIAIPNFIAYRNKSFCSAAESDANSVAGGLSDYFAIPSHRVTPAAAATGLYNLAREGKLDAAIAMTGENLLTVSNLNQDPNNDVWITVVDGSGRCPLDYRLAQDVVRNPTGYWDTGATDTNFHLLMR
jgi:prepilin-type N-terminal cleavage/methylation domain-containing protein